MREPVHIDVQIMTHSDNEHDVNVYLVGTNEHIDELERSFQTETEVDAYVSELLKDERYVTYLWD